MAQLPAEQLWNLLQVLQTMVLRKTGTALDFLLTCKAVTCSRSAAALQAAELALEWQLAEQVEVHTPAATLLGGSPTAIIVLLYLVAVLLPKQASRAFTVLPVGLA